MSEPKPFTGRSRDRKTQRSVIFSDVLSRVLITFGGIGTIIAVLGVCVFLVWVVIPLFRSADISDPTTIRAESRTQTPLHIALDEYQSAGWMLFPDGQVRVFQVDTGQVLAEQQLFENQESRITCTAFPNQRREAIFGFSDGTIALLNIYFETTFLNPDSIPRDIQETLTTKREDGAVPFEGGVVQLTPEGQFRHQHLRVEKVISDKVSESPVHLVDLVVRPSGPLIAVLTGSAEKPELKAISGREKENFLTGGKSFAFGPPVFLPLEPHAAEIPHYLAISGPGSDIYVAWKDGWLERVRCETLQTAFIAEKGQLVDLDASLTAMGFVLGNNTLIWGDSKGNVRGGFTVRTELTHGPGLSDVIRDKVRGQYSFAITKELARTDTKLLSLAPSSYSRLLICGFEDGQVHIYYVTNEETLGAIQVPSREPVIALNVSPKEDGFLAVTPTRFYHYRLDPRHPEVTFRSLFRPVWYEGYSQPLHMWQSSSATDDSEPKFGLVPLVFGTIKATFYAMLFGAPLALLAAVYSSEFLHSRMKAAVKPTIELMASLPSVVLGFLAALVFAPFIERIVPTTMIVFLMIPFSFLFLSYVWQLLPVGFTRRMAHWRMLFFIIPLLLGIFLAVLLGPMLENLLFSGDIKNWLAWSPRTGDVTQEKYRSAIGGWFLLCLPFCACFMAVLNTRYISPGMRRLTSQLERKPLAWVELGKFFATVIFSLVFAALIALAMDRLGFDPRSNWIIWSVDWSPVDIYVQRNALIVGFVMGFAIIPIIYTIADDALSAVPQHLRSASLGSGATPWQTAVRIVIPTAMSGIFSALMIGLGRAVGETMIVLMALGNTPIMDWNLFNGARTLSANIAVEMPEAVRNSTHYRTLFLAALVLFAMTFVVNTIAELVRLRFRKRSYQL